MMPLNHVIISTAGGGALALWFQSPMAGIAFFITGVFIDLDHHLDYFLARKKIPLQYKELVDFCAYDPHGHLYLFFHAYELLVLAWAAVYYLDLNIIWVGAILGATVHVICDQAVNPLKPLGYFFLYRLSQGFKRKNLFTKEHCEKIF